MPLEQNIPYGLCWCGCGRNTTIPTRTVSHLNRFEGVPMRFISGHNRVKERVDGNALGHFKIDGVYCRLIPLTKGQYAIVWESDYEWLNQWRWNAHWNSHSRSFYAVRTDTSGNTKVTIQMHRLILGLSSSIMEQGDHANLNGTDNRRDNLRVANDIENAQNRRGRRHSKSGLKGVSWRHDSGNYVASITVNGKRLTLGRSHDPLVCVTRCTNKQHSRTLENSREISE